MARPVRPPYQRIADELREELEGGLYPEGEAIPSTTQLQARFGVANMTVRSALTLLRQEGYLESFQGRGWYPVAARLRQIRTGPSAEAEIEEVRREEDPVEQARMATELLKLYEVRTTALSILRRRAIERAERKGMKRIAIAKKMGVSRGRLTQIMDEAPPARARSSAARG